MNKKILSILFLTVLVYSSCVRDKFDDTVPSETEFSDLIIPEGFDFSTQKHVKVNINDSEKGIIYDVYAYSESLDEGPIVDYVNDEGATESSNIPTSDILNHLIFRATTTANGIEKVITLPSYYSKVYIRRKDNSKYTAQVVSVLNSEVNYTPDLNSGKSARASKSSVEDFLYCVNGQGELFQVDPLTGDYVSISDMPMGSYTAAIDQENKLLYSIGRKSPFPLMKYDIANDTWETVADVGIGGPRLDYNDTDGLLYFSKSNKLYSIDPLNGVIISTWDIVGLDNNGGGDIAFAENGDLYLCSFSGLYKLALDQNGVYQSDRISAEGLPFSPTSMTFDSNNELWLSENSADASLVIMDIQTGGWQYQYGVRAENGTSIGRALNDLTTFRVFNEDAEVRDSDGDGISDNDDEYPNDPGKAFETFSPSKYGWGTVAFEDLWPATGDYDFNDIAVNYRIVAIENSSNEVVQLDFNILVTSNGASFTNAFGIELKNIDPSQVQEVTGAVLTQGYIQNNPNGTEANQDKAVIILYDDNFAMLNKPFTVSIVFNSPVRSENLGVAPYNPFMIVNKIREKEVHLPFENTTSLGRTDLDFEGENKDIDGNFVTDNGLPWAINIVHNFKIPKEKISVDRAYNHFRSWAMSGGTTFRDWYKDSNGYRNESNLKQ